MGNIQKYKKARLVLNSEVVELIRKIESVEGYGKFFLNPNNVSYINETILYSSKENGVEKINLTRNEGFLNHFGDRIDELFSPKNTSIIKINDLINEFNDEFVSNLYIYGKVVCPYTGETLKELSIDRVMALFDTEEVELFHNGGHAKWLLCYSQLGKLNIATKLDEIPTPYEDYYEYVVNNYSKQFIDDRVNFLSDKVNVFPVIKDCFTSVDVNTPFGLTEKDVCIDKDGQRYTELNNDVIYLDLNYENKITRDEEIKALYVGDLKFEFDIKRTPLFTLDNLCEYFVFELDDDIRYPVETVLNDDDFITLKVVNGEVTSIRDNAEVFNFIDDRRRLLMEVQGDKSTEDISIDMKTQYAIKQLNDDKYLMQGNFFDEEVWWGEFKESDYGLSSSWSYDVAMEMVSKYIPSNVSIILIPVEVKG